VRALKCARQPAHAPGRALVCGLQKQWHIQNFANKVKVWKAEAKAEQRVQERLARCGACGCMPPARECAPAPCPLPPPCASARKVWRVPVCTEAAPVQYTRI
jgi:hypothetical protein